MNNSLLKSITAGLLLGLALFIMPFFLIRLAFFLLLVGALFRLFGAGRFRRGWGRGYGHMPAFVDRIRQMSDAEYTEFKERYKGRWSDASGQEKSENSSNQ